MLLKTAAIVLLSSTSARADNTPNLCSGDIPNLQRIAPSETGITNIPGKNVTTSMPKLLTKHYNRSGKKVNVSYLHTE